MAILVTTNCGLCDAVTVNGYVCHKCQYVILEKIVYAGVTRETNGETVYCLLDELDIQLSRRSRQSARVGGHAANEPLPYDPRAARCHSIIAEVLTRWAMHYGAQSISGPRSAARWLEKNLAKIVMSADSSVMYDELKRAVSEGMICIDRSQSSVYVGICSAPVISGYCSFDLYALPDAPTITCPRCQTSHSVESRRLVLLAAAEDELMNASDLASIISRAGLPVTRDQVYKWKMRGMLSVTCINRTGEPIYRLGDVLALARNSHLRKLGLADRMR